MNLRHSLSPSRRAGRVGGLVLAALLAFGPAAAAAAAPPPQPTAKPRAGNAPAAKRPAAAAKDPKKAPAGLLRLPTFGVALAPPAGWREVLRDNQKVVAEWESPDSTGQRQNAIVRVEVGRAADANADATAQGMARNWGGTVVGPTTLGGAPAVHVRAENTAEGRMRPIEGIVCRRGEHLYLLMGGVVPGHKAAEQVEAVRASWKWVDFEPPSAHLRPRARPFPAFGGAVSLNFPALMHTVPVQHPDRELHLAVHNVRRGRPDYIALVQLVPLGGAESFNGLKDRFLEQLQQRLKVAEPLK